MCRASSPSLLSPTGGCRSKASGVAWRQLRYSRVKARGIGEGRHTDVAVEVVVVVIGLESRGFSTWQAMRSISRFVRAVKPGAGERGTRNGERFLSVDSVSEWLGTRSNINVGWNPSRGWAAVFRNKHHAVKLNGRLYNPQLHSSTWCTCR